MDNKPPIHISKRIFDVILSLLFILLLLPLHLLFLFLIFIEHILRGVPLAPLFYSETRWSANKPFKMYKYNIFDPRVIKEAELSGDFINTKTLERSGDVILIGKLLKQIYLDEVPQFINVIKGDMSIVGPRPVNTYYHQKFINENYLAKTKVKAGITGYYQSLHKSERTRSGSQVELDTLYVNHYQNNPWYKHLLFDLYILLRTILVIIFAKGI